MANFIGVGTDTGVAAEVRIFADADLDGQNYALVDTLRPFGGFTGGVRIAFGDFDGDLNDELAVAAGPGGGPHVKIYDLAADGKIGAMVDEFFAYGAFSGGVNIAAGDLNGDGYDELVTAPDFGGAPRVLIFSDSDRDDRLSDNLIDSFLAFNAGFFGGVRLALGNIDLATRSWKSSLPTRPVSAAACASPWATPMRRRSTQS